MAVSQRGQAWLGKNGYSSCADSAGYPGLAVLRTSQLDTQHVLCCLPWMATCCWSPQVRPPRNTTSKSTPPGRCRPQFSPGAARCGPSLGQNEWREVRSSLRATESANKYPGDQHRSLASTMKSDPIQLVRRPAEGISAVGCPSHEVKRFLQ